MSNGLSFQDLLGKVRAGDQNAAQELVQRYEPAIRRAVRLRLADSRLVRLLDSIDVCQSVFLSFFQRTAAGQYEIEAPDQLLKLLVTMARNKLALQVRAQQRQRRDYRRIQPGALVEMLIAGSEPTPSVNVSGQELLEEARRLFTPEEWELIELRKEGVDWNAIAEKLGSSSEALRKKLTRAVDRVARELELDPE